MHNKPWAEVLLGHLQTDPVLKKKKKKNYIYLSLDVEFLNFVTYYLRSVLSLTNVLLSRCTYPL